jgi:hypothetical protein
MIMTILHLRSLNNQVEEGEMGRACSTNGEKSNVGKPEGKKLLGKPRRRWVDNIRMDLGELGWDGVNWIDLAQDRDR